MPQGNTADAKSVKGASHAPLDAGLDDGSEDAGGTDTGALDAAEGIVPTTDAQFLQQLFCCPLTKVNPPAHAIVS